MKASSSDTRIFDPAQGTVAAVAGPRPVLPGVAPEPLCYTGAMSIGPVLAAPCLECGAIGSVEFVVSENGEAGFECIQCGALYEKRSEKGDYDALYDLAALLAEEPSQGG